MMIQRLFKSIRYCAEPKDKFDDVHSLKSDVPDPDEFIKYDILPAAVAVFSNKLDRIYSNASFNMILKRRCSHLADILDPGQIKDLTDTIIGGNTWQGLVSIRNDQDVSRKSTELEHEAICKGQQYMSYKALSFISKSVDKADPSISSDSDLFNALYINNNSNHRYSDKDSKNYKVYNFYCNLDLCAKHIMVLAVDVTQRTQAEKSMLDVLEAEHAMLESMFPRHVLEYIAKQRVGEYRNVDHILKGTNDNQVLATRHNQVTVMFADITGFTPMCSTQEPLAVMSFLNNMFSRFDSLLDLYGVYKVETIGDCYVVAGGLVNKDDNGMVTIREDLDKLNAIKVVKFAKALAKEARKVQMPGSESPVKLRIGIHTGPIVSGIVGKRMPRFCMFGDTMNTAARMEATAKPGTIHASSQTRSMTTKEKWIYNGPVSVKGKGEMQTYTLYVRPSSIEDKTWHSNRRSFDNEYFDIIHNHFRKTSGSK